MVVELVLEASGWGSKDQLRWCNCSRRGEKVCVVCIG
jgi:hypothetical protein